MVDANHKRQTISNQKTAVCLMAARHLQDSEMSDTPREHTVRGARRGRRRKKKKKKNSEKAINLEPHGAMQNTSQGSFGST